MTACCASHAQGAPGFRHYRFRDDLFPTRIFRQAWEQLNQWHAPRRADLIYLQILQLAARTLEDEVATVLEQLVNQGAVWNKEDVDRLLKPDPVVVPVIAAGVVDLAQYDQLLGEVSHEPA